MLPPGPHRYFFSISGEPCVAKDQPVTHKKEERKNKKIFLDTSKLDVAALAQKFKNNTKPTPKKNNMWFKNKNPEPE